MEEQEDKQQITIFYECVRVMKGLGINIPADGVPSVHFDTFVLDGMVTLKHRMLYFPYSRLLFLLLAAILVLCPWGQILTHIHCYLQIGV